MAFPHSWCLVSSPDRRFFLSKAAECGEDRPRPPCPAVWAASGAARGRHPGRPGSLALSCGPTGAGKPRRPGSSRNPVTSERPSPAEAGSRSCFQSAAAPERDRRQRGAGVLWDCGKGGSRWDLERGGPTCRRATGGAHQADWCRKARFWREGRAFEQGQVLQRTGLVVSRQPGRRPRERRAIRARGIAEGR